MDHLQPHVNLEHVDRPEEALATRGLTEPKEVGEEKHTSNSRTAMANFGQFYVGQFLLWPVLLWPILLWPVLRWPKSV